jgi:hypothetical protein
MFLDSTHVGSVATLRSQAREGSTVKRNKTNPIINPDMMLLSIMRVHESRVPAWRGITPSDWPGILEKSTTQLLKWCIAVTSADVTDYSAIDLGLPVADYFETPAEQIVGMLLMFNQFSESALSAPPFNPKDCIHFQGIARRVTGFELKKHVIKSGKIKQEILSQT